MNFDQWIAEVNRILFDKGGTDTDTLGDMGWHTMFINGKSPEEAAKTSLLKDGFPEDEY